MDIVSKGGSYGEISALKKLASQTHDRAGGGGSSDKSKFVLQ